MTLIRRAGPWDDVLALRRTIERLLEDDVRHTGSSAAVADTQPEPELVGAGNRR